MFPLLLSCIFHSSTQKLFKYLHCLFDFLISNLSMRSLCYDKRSPAIRLFLSRWTSNINIMPSTCERCLFEKIITVSRGTEPAAAIKTVIWGRRCSSCWWWRKDHFSMSGTPGTSETHTPRTALRGTSTAAKRNLQPNFSSKVPLWGFPAGRTALAPRGRLVKHSFIPPRKGRNTRWRAAAFFTSPICFRWAVLALCSGGRPPVRKAFIQHMPKSHWPDWGSSLCFRFVLNQGLKDGIFFFFLLI